VPLVVGLVFGALALPHAADPEDVPLPQADARALAHVIETDRALAAKARHDLLPPDVRELGSAIREFNTRQAHDETEARLADARRAIDLALPGAVDTNNPESLVALRAAQVEAFLAETHAFEATGKESDELSALAGPFVREMRAAGWCREHTILMPDEARRTAYKLTWNALLGLGGRRELAPTLDELRMLYRFYLEHPHAPEGARARIDAARGGARTAASCASLDAGEQMAAESWRLDKIKRLGAFDPAYPTDFAIGVSLFRHGSFGASAEAFRDWLRVHPDGPYALRAKNHLRAALLAAGLQ
jgi:hypothetical protein